MITPSHLIYSWALAKKTSQKPANPAEKLRVVAFILGALLPDIPVYVFFLVCGVLLGYGHDLLWNDMYFNSKWSVAFTLSHSLLLWPLLYLVARYKQWFVVLWIAISAIFHIMVDFCVHTVDAYQHFWPLSDWRFMSPLSYWDRAAYGQYVGLLDGFIVLGLLVWLFSRYEQSYARLGIGLLILLATVRLCGELLNF